MPTRVTAAVTAQTQAARIMPLLLGSAVVLCFLYFARTVIIPVALAVLFTFLLTPLCRFLEHRHVPRPAAVGVVTLFSLSLLIGIGYLVTHQIGSLLDAYPKYEDNITAKIQHLRARGHEGLLDKVQQVAERLQHQLEAGEKPAAPVMDGGRVVQPVRVVDESPFRMSQLWAAVGPLLEPLANLGLIVVLVMFMLLNREDLRDRVLALGGTNQLASTTRALGDAGERVSRYLLMQLIVNVAYGLVVMLGLWLIGIPYAPLWGFFAMLLRYIPYLGPWVAALLPITMSLLISREWTLGLEVVALFAVVELITNMILEPLLYGKGLGVSQAALLIAVAFWTWLWGPVGLVLASPLTVCLVVLGRYVPYLRFLDTLLGDKPTLSPAQRFYQRLLAGDEDEATRLLEERNTEDTNTRVYDEVVVPALTSMRVDEREQRLDMGKRREMTALAQQVVEAHQPIATPEVQNEAAQPKRGRVLCVPARDAVDSVAARMLAQLADPTRLHMDVEGHDRLANLVAERAQLEDWDAIAIVCVPPGGMAHTRHLCKRIRAVAPDTRIVVVRPGLYPEDVEQHRKQVMEAGATRMASTLAEGFQALQAYAHLD